MAAWRRFSSLKLCNNIHSSYRMLSQKRLIKAAIIGEANSGKSSLLNALVERKLSAVTAIPHTTRRSVDGCVTYDDEGCQIVLTDTPGIIGFSEAHRLKIDGSHARAPNLACLGCDLIIVMIDSANRKTRSRIHPNILDILREYSQLKSVLILNKVDLVKHKPLLLDLCQLLTTNDEGKDKRGFDNFSHIFMTSLVNNEGLSDVINTLRAMALPGDWIYSQNVATNQTAEEQICEVIRENVLKLYPHEIPWQMKQVIVKQDKGDDGTILIHHKLVWPRPSQVRFVNTRLRELKERTTLDLYNILHANIHLTIDLGVKKNMTRDEVMFNSHF